MPAPVTTPLPAYAHGNDSGWDNASFFAEGGPVVAPDLATFLILACDLLADLTASAAGADQADRLTAILLRDLWDGDTFGTRLLSAPATLRTGQSLIQFMPLLLGKRLPAAMAASLVARLQQPGYLTQWGPATENTASPLLRSRRLLARPDLGPDHLPALGRPARPGPDRSGHDRGRMLLPPVRDLRHGREL